MSEDQDRSKIISQINQAQLDYDKEVKNQSRNNVIRIIVMLMAIVALFMALR